MKNIFIMLLLGSALIISTTVNASTNGGDKCCKKTSCCKKMKCCKNNKECCSTDSSCCKEGICKMEEGKSSSCSKDSSTVETGCHSDRKVNAKKSCCK